MLRTGFGGYNEVRNAVMPPSGMMEAIEAQGSPPGLPKANPEVQTFPYVPEKIGGDIGYHEQPPSEEYMDIANNVALSKHYAYLFMKDWPLYVGGTAVVLYLVLRR